MYTHIYIYIYVYIYHIIYIYLLIYLRSGTPSTELATLLSVIYLSKDI